MPDGNRAQFAVSEAGEVIESEPRRKFLARLFWGAMGIVSAAIAAPVISYLIIPLLRPGESNDWVKMGNIADLPLNVPQRLEVGRRVVEGWETDDSQVTAWVVRMPDKIYVFDPHCTHLGCAYRWVEQEKQFFCPCHAGVFSLTGQVVSGPPPRPLDVYAHEVREGALYVVPTPTKQVV
ncbi:ubiquinol-cytochrome c reductase iron-sulfur subunit [Candidatus Binatus sp.]|uniref:QcrA and Rieske domain-containing protein n=1 Tax=Candidatus Binatus sp. TaxID=2811406 RepID=UPI003C3CB353